LTVLIFNVEDQGGAGVAGVNVSGKFSPNFSVDNFGAQNFDITTDNTGQAKYDLGWVPEGGSLTVVATAAGYETVNETLGVNGMNLTQTYALQMAQPGQKPGVDYLTQIELALKNNWLLILVGATSVVLLYSFITMSSADRRKVLGSVGETTKQLAHSAAHETKEAVKVAAHETKKSIEAYRSRDNSE
jgi:hypothetical protein